MPRKGIPIELQKPKPLSTASIIRGKQAKSLVTRKIPVTLNKPDWEDK